MNSARPLGSLRDSLRLWKIVCCMLSAALLPMAAAAKPLPASIFAATKEFGIMGWNAWQSDPVFHVLTSRYILHYNHRELGPVNLSPLSKAADAGRALTADAPQGWPVSLKCRLLVNGTKHDFVPASADPRDCAIVESGIFFQRRWQSAIPANGPAVESKSTGLESSFWPDRIAFILHHQPTASQADPQGLQMAFSIPRGLQVVSANSTQVVVADERGRGLVARGLGEGARLVYQNESRNVVVELPARAVGKDETIAVGLALFPLADCRGRQPSRLEQETMSPLEVSARQVAPDDAPCEVSHSAWHDWYKIPIPKGPDDDNGTVRVRVRVKNPSAFQRVARFNFDGVPFYVPGLSAVLRDVDGCPIGLPVQLSKNWHGPPKPNNRPAGFGGLWFHGLTLMVIPAGGELEFEIMMVGENWGGMAAASHSQLSLMGYGGNQQWDQAALGNKGETFCYDMDYNLTPNDFTDSRPFFTLDPSGKRNWGINVGGGAILRYTDASGQSRRHIRNRVRTLRHGPNLAEAAFAGTTDDGAIDFSFSAGLFRSDDCSRGVHRIRMVVRKRVDFQRLVIYQQAGDSYSYNQGNTFSIGNAASDAPTLTWQAGLPDGQIEGKAILLKGPQPWAAVTNGTEEKGYLPANHGLVIRSWQARLGGRTALVPFVRERRNDNNVPILEIVPPPDVRSLLPGDYVDLTLVRVYVPRAAASYAGPNTAFRKALQTYENDPRMFQREAAGNRLMIKPSIGTVVRNFPTILRASENRAAFTIEGGVSALPLTVSGLTTYRVPVLEEKSGGGWKRIDQSVHGNDYWQADYQPVTGTWDITFTLPSPVAVEPSRPVREFRFSMVVR